MKLFLTRLRALLEAHSAARPVAARTWLYVPYDQLTCAIGPLAMHPPQEVGIVLIEAPKKAARRPYHKQKLALVLTSQRHFALEQAARGVAVRYRVSDTDYAGELELLCRELGPLTMMEAAERELRVELAPLIAAGKLKVVPHAGWLSTSGDFQAAVGTKPPWRMDAFYRHMRKQTGLLMEKGKPVGGKFSFDAENRLAWKGQPPAPTRPEFVVDEITQEVVDLILTQYAHHPGTLKPSALPATQADVETTWAFALRECLPHFGPYEDAMSTRSATLFHACVSGLINLHRLLPGRAVAEVATNEDFPLASREGFVRQILGWREFVRHVHVATDGFRHHLPTDASATSGAGDGGFARWAGQPWQPDHGHGGASPAFLEAPRGLPPAWWGTRSGLGCLDHVVKDVWADGFSHHITRLMVLSNLATLLGVNARELTDWFWVAYVDAYDWVVEPNVLAMGTFAVGEVMTTKPYVAGAAYINKMSDYCRGCAFDPKRTCPITRLYWAFLDRHATRLAGNHRLSVPLAALRKRSPAERATDQRYFELVGQALDAGREISPETLEPSSQPAQRSVFD